MICYLCKTVIGYNWDGTDQKHVACKRCDCNRVYCPECAKAKNTFDFCEVCNADLCRNCAVSVRDPEDDRVELFLTCDGWCKEDVLKGLDHE
jgi:hypothetical protein